MKKILIDACSLTKNRTGIGNYIFRLLEEIRLNNEYKIILISNKKIYFNDYDNIKKIYPHKILSKILIGPLWVQCYFQFYALILKPNVIWGANGFLPILSINSLKVVTIYDFTHKFYPNSQKFTSRLNRFLFQTLAIRMSSNIISISNSTRNDLIKLHPFSKNKKHILIPPALDFNKSYKNYKNKFDNNEYGEYVITVGTLEPRKNLDSLINGFIKYKKNNLESKLKLIIVGGTGWKYDLQVKHDDILMMGYLDDHIKSNLICGAIAFIFPSHYEGFGMPVTEAQLLGIPIICSDCPAVIEAAGNIAIIIKMTIENIYNVLLKIESKELPLVCRLMNNEEYNPARLANLLVNESFNL